MSHNATNWAIRQRGLKPATKLVLWHLCDRHNPDQGCFPSQDKLAHDCEMSRSSLNDHLSILEDRGLIRRAQRINEATRRQQSTSYVFSFEDGFVCAPRGDATQDVEIPCLKSGHGAVSENQQKPCPKNEESRVRNSDTNLVREPVREPSSAQAWAGLVFRDLWSDWPDANRPANKPAAEAVFGKLSEPQQRRAMANAAQWRKLQMLRRRPIHMITYLKSKDFDDIENAPPMDSDGDFIITAERPEWHAWLNDARERFGDVAANSAVRLGKMLRRNRWPDGHVAVGNDDRHRTCLSDCSSQRAALIPAVKSKMTKFEITQEATCESVTFGIFPRGTIRVPAPLGSKTPHVGSAYGPQRIGGPKENT